MNSGAGQVKLHKAVLMEIIDTTKENVYIYIKLTQGKVCIKNTDPKRS